MSNQLKVIQSHQVIARAASGRHEADRLADLDLIKASRPDARSELRTVIGTQRWHVLALELPQLSM